MRYSDLSSLVLLASSTLAAAETPPHPLHRRAENPSIAIGVSVACGIIAILFAIWCWRQWRKPWTTPDRIKRSPTLPPSYGVSLQEMRPPEYAASATSGPTARWRVGRRVWPGFRMGFRHRETRHRRMRPNGGLRRRRLLSALRRRRRVKWERVGSRCTIPNGISIDHSIKQRSHRRDLCLHEESNAPSVREGDWTWGRPPSRR
ncbi:hypothetical protein B0T16DRAFT_410319 [Cercophora newfieldiana]|uniref:Uncharacterized protein n=1 Tax=Cercophora newfieldiana TaxID=92897 RepID=A0AA39YEJ0_9PEZI|nr:hypothetical protein B0T16DRAFT_410319 [Cercophora newfieldiana]